MTEKFDQWAIVELFGHSRIAGRVTEQVIGGCSFVRVDVPSVDGNQPFTKLYGQGAIYAMSFVDEETAIGAAEMMSERPVDEWSARRMLKIEAPRVDRDEIWCTDEDDDGMQY